jgi:hypothetical protein
VPASNACTGEPFTTFAASYRFRKQPKYAQRLSPELMTIVWLFTPLTPYSGLLGSVRLGELDVAKNGMVWLSLAGSGQSGNPFESLWLG